MPRAKIVVSDHFTKLGVDYHRAANRALERSAAVTVAATRSAATEYQIGDIEASVGQTPVFSTRRGRAVIVRATDYRFRFFEFGTYARRRRKLKRPRTKPRAQAIAAKRGSGVKAQRTMVKGMLAGRLALERYLAIYFRMVR